MQSEVASNKLELDRSKHESGNFQQQIQKLQQIQKHLEEGLAQSQAEAKKVEADKAEAVAALENKNETLETELKSIAKRIKDKERKLAALESKLTDLEDEKLLMFEQNKEQLQSKQAIYLHQIEDSKRR